MDDCQEGIVAPVLMPRHVKISYDKQSGATQVDVTGLNEYQLSFGLLVSAIADKHARDADGLIEAAKRGKGIVIVRGQNGIRVLNDPFCTLPLYYKDTPQKFIASSDPQCLISYQDHPFDEVGVWETLLLNGPLWNRTPYKDLHFLPAACEVEVGSKTTLKRYWNFEFHVDEQPFDSTKYLDRFDDLLNQKFSEIDASAIYMGLSGGGDSRIAAHYLARNKKKFDKIELITYAAHANSKEYVYACEVAKALQLPAPHLHLLVNEHYVEALGYLPQWSAGQINHQHGHLTSYLKHQAIDKPGQVHLSNYYTDAVFGWDCGTPRPLNDIRTASAYKAIEACRFISDDVREQMREDCRLALSVPQGAEQYLSSLDEYKYIVERHPRFHMSLAFMQSQYMSTVLPFADMDVLALAMQAPIEFRERKNLLAELMSHVNAALASIGSSGSHEYFHGGISRLANGTLLERMEFRKFRALNMLNQLIAKVSRGALRFPNPYQTEDQVAVYRKNFQRLEAAVLSNSKLQTCVGQAAMSSMLANDLVLRNLAERFHLISFDSLCAGKN